MKLGAAAVTEMMKCCAKPQAAYFRPHAVGVYQIAHSGIVGGFYRYFGQAHYPQRSGTGLVAIVVVGGSLVAPIYMVEKECALYPQNHPAAVGYW